MSTEFYLVAVVLTTVLSAARLTRLFVIDKFPPTFWLRHKYAEVLDRTDRSRGWALLLFCGYCASFWLFGAVLLWGYVVGVYDAVSRNSPTDAEVAWWLINGLLGGSYLAAMAVARDGDDGEDD